MPLYKYTPYITAGPNGVNLRFRANETDATELAEVDGAVYVHVPDGTVLPEQPAEINWQSVTPDAELLARIKAESRSVQLISQAMVEKIRARYTLEDEQYFSRIGVGVALGAYTFQPGEQEELLAFGEFVEGVRRWGRAERAKIGLA